MNNKDEFQMQGDQIQLKSNFAKDKPKLMQTYALNDFNK